jgi:hypothetical protein
MKSSKTAQLQSLRFRLLFLNAQNNPGWQSRNLCRLRQFSRQTKQVGDTFWVAPGRPINNGEL